MPQFNDGTRARLQELLAHHRLSEPVHVTRPTMPSLEDYNRLVRQIWNSRWLTNNGPIHQEFEARLAAHLGVEHVSLFCNGTIALLVALHALRINGGDVITTPFTFPATAHVLYWNHIRPVFCDIDPSTFNLDPSRIEQLIGPDTKAILPVHVFGVPCDVEAIQEIADRHGLHVIYDAAHAFGARYRGRPLADYGDVSMMSFHATKLFSTFEGGALVMKSRAQKERIDFLKNFGIADQETVVGPGINGKMNELQAAFGLLQLEGVDEEIAHRAALVDLYRSELADVPGVTFLEDIEDVRHNYANFSVLIHAETYGTTRDHLHDLLAEFNVFTRKYFHPLCSHYPCYSALPSARPEHLPVAEQVARDVLCLPLYGHLDQDVVRCICTILRGLRDLALKA